MRLFDLHCDTLYECCEQHTGDLYENTGHIDLKRGLSAANPWFQVFAVWTPDDNHGSVAFDRCCRILRWVQEQERVYTDRTRIIRKAKDLYGTENDPHCRAILAVEGGHSIGGDLQNLSRLKELDVKLITLTWNHDNELGHGAASDSREGLTAFGKQVVTEMERLGLIVDVSHLNERGFWDVAEQATRPFVASHSVSAAVCDHPRNLTDAQFQAIRDAGGVVGLNVCADQLGEQSFECLERHLEHYLSLGGEHTVAMGTDLDGTSLRPDWPGIGMLPQFYEYLSRKNYEESLLDRVFFGNSYDFFAKALQFGN